MASFTLTTVDRFPVGTSVAAYAGGVPIGGGAPAGSAVNTQSMGSDGLTFTGLADETDYVAYAEVGGQHRHVTFSTRTTSAGSLTSDVELAAHVADTTNVHGIANTEEIGTDNTDADLAARGTVIASATLTATSEIVTASNTATDLTGLAITVPQGTRPYIVRAVGPVTSQTADRQCGITICLADNTVKAASFGTSPVAAQSQNHVAETPPQAAPTGGSVVYKVRLTSVAGTNVGTYVPGTATTPFTLVAIAC